jgi:hypothetical protein
MAQTLSAWDAMLKEWYEPSVVSQIENKTRILKSFGEADAPTVDGRRVVFPLHIGRNTGVMSSVEGATLPTAGRQNYVDVHIPLRKTVGRINITKDVIDSSRTNRGSFKRAMSTEMEGLVRDITDYRNEMLCGYGTGIVAQLSATGSSGTTHTVTVDNPGGFTGTTNPNRYVQNSQFLALVRNGAIPSGGCLTVTAVTESGSYNQFTATSTGTVTPTDNDYLVRAATSSTTTLTDTDWQNPIMGLFGLIDDGTYVRVLHGVDRQTYPVFRSFVLSSVGALSLDALQRAFDAAETKGQGTISEMWCEHGVRRAYLQLLEADRRYTSEKLMSPDGGTKAVKGSDITFGGVPFKTERDFPFGVVAGVDKDTLQRYVNVRGQWEDTDGNVLFRSANTHDFTALWYMKDNFSCDRPNSNFRMDGITTTAISIHID